MPARIAQNDPSHDLPHNSKALSRASADVVGYVHIETYRDGRLWRFLPVGRDLIAGLHRLPDSGYTSSHSQSAKEGFRAVVGGDIVDLSIVRGR